MMAKRKKSQRSASRSSAFVLPGSMLSTCNRALIPPLHGSENARLITSPLPELLHLQTSFKLFQKSRARPISHRFLNGNTRRSAKCIRTLPLSTSRQEVFSHGGTLKSPLPAISATVQWHRLGFLHQSDR